jgi:hypothetical protein
VLLGAATGAGAWAGSTAPRAHSAENAVPDLTGTWENIANTHGSPPWLLNASNGLKNLEAHWHGGPGYHENLSGEFHGTLSADGTSYEGPYSITEADPNHPSTGAAKFTIQNANRIKLDIGAESIVFTRLGAALSPSPGAVTPTSTPPALGKTTLYEAPAPGATASNPLPRVAAVKEGVLEGEITFVDSKGEPVPGPPMAAVEAQAERASQVCVLFFTAELLELDQDFKKYKAGLPTFITCVDTVSRVLARNEELQRTKAKTGARAKAATRTCGLLVRGKGRAHSPLRVRCTPTATGLRVDIRPRSSKQTLAKALRGHAKLIVARSAVTPGPAGLRLRELWRAK